MAVVDVGLLEESQTRYLTYALSVVNSRALPDVRDGLKPVQRRILYAMFHSLHLTPDKAHRKSAAVVGEVLARFHPHGDAACYEAMVRMAQSFSLRYPLVDGQGNFGSLDGDSAAAYRYTEAKLTALALEVIGEIGQGTVAERDNFDQTTMEPIVLPSRVPNLLINGASGIAVGMATAIPPHNLGEVVKALLLLIEDSEATDAKLLGAIKGPDFPTGCSILTTKSELKAIYSTGRGAIRMRGDYKIEHGKRGKIYIVITSIPYGIDKSALVESIAEIIIARKVSQLTDIRDESTDDVRIVVEITSEAEAEKALAYLFKHTTLQHNFNVNLTALIPTNNPTSGRPAQLTLREMLAHFVQFRLDVTKSKLEFERGKLETRIHLLDGLISVFDAITEVISIVRKSEGRGDGAEKLQKRFKLSEAQALFIVDLHIYQLSRTSIEDLTSEHAEKSARVKEINKILKSERLLREVVAEDLKRVSDLYADPRRSQVVTEFEEVEFRAEEYLQHEDAYVIVTKDGWLKRIRQTNDPETTRLREGDSLFFAKPASTRDSLAIFTSQGNVFVSRVFDLSATSGFGEPVQKLFKFGDGEQVIACMIITRNEAGELDMEKQAEKEVLLYTAKGFGFRMGVDFFAETKKGGRRIVRVGERDEVRGVFPVPADPRKNLALFVSEEGYGVVFLLKEIPTLSGAAKGVILQKLPGDDRLALACVVAKDDKVQVEVANGGEREIEIREQTIASRARRGVKVIKRGAPVVGIKRI